MRAILLFAMVMLLAGPAGAASLRVRSTPAGATIYLGTDAGGTTPATLDGLAPGRIAVTIVREGYRAETRVVSLPEQGEATLDVTLELLPAQVGMVAVAAPPGGRLLLGGNPLAELPSPPMAVNGVPAGRQRLTWQHADFFDAIEEVVVPTGGTVSVTFSPLPRPGKLLVVSNPSGAYLRVGGQFLGKTPATLEVPPGDLSLEISHLDYRRDARDVEIESNREIVVTVDLLVAGSGDTMCPTGTGLVPTGVFSMGHPNYRIGPAHEVSLDPYCMDTYEVSWRRWATCVAAGKCPEIAAPSGLGAPDQPVVGVTWFEASEFCRSQGGRLPTEAEWERAARGPHGANYPWGDQAPSCQRAWFHGCASTQRTAAVGSFAAGASPEGFHDLAGNVFEWVHDWMEQGYYERSPTANPRGPAAGEYRVLRGGGFSSEGLALAGWARQAYTPDSRLANLGFRCVTVP